MPNTPLTPEELARLQGYWSAANYLSAGQIYLRDNPLLQQPLTPDHIKPALLGHWGTVPGQNFIITHLNRVILRERVSLLYVCGPGHGGPAVFANSFLEGTYSHLYPHVPQNKQGILELFKQFSTPGGVPSHASPDCPGSLHEGGELGYSLSHAFGAVLDNPQLIAACVVGDGEAETGPIATAWHSNKFLDPVNDGVVLPFLHLNGYKIANPTLLARIPKEELEQLFLGYGWQPLWVEGEQPEPMHQAMAQALDTAIALIKTYKQTAQQQHQTGQPIQRPKWPMVILRSPKGWTGPATVDGLPNTNSFRAHQVPITQPRQNPQHLALLETWLRSYQPQELFDENGALHANLSALVPEGDLRLSANPCANGGQLLQPLALPNPLDFGFPLKQRGEVAIGDSRYLGPYLRQVFRLNEPHKNFRLFGPDETASNGLAAVFEQEQRQWDAQVLPSDLHLNHHGRVMDAMLSEHQCQGWLEGYLLTGRHGLFNCYEAFIHIVDSMVNQHAKWLKVSAQIPWRAPLASLNYLLASHVWRQDHNGFSHQDPGFIDHVVNKKAEVVRVYLPPDANCLLWVMHHCLESKHYINVVVAGKHPSPQWLSPEEAQHHCAAGIGIWPWASTPSQAPQLVMACCGDVPTLETLAAVQLLQKALPELSLQVVNVVDLMRLQHPSAHPHGLSDEAFAGYFPLGVPVIFAFHGYPALVHKLIYKRANAIHFHVHGYKEEGSTTTPFDMTVLNQLDRFHLALNAVSRLPETDTIRQAQAQWQEQLRLHSAYIRHHGVDMDSIRHWHW